MEQRLRQHNQRGNIRSTTSWIDGYVGDGVLDIPSAARRQFGMRKNMPIEVIFLRRVVEDADPYG